MILGSRTCARIAARTAGGAAILAFAALAAGAPASAIEGSPPTPPPAAIPYAAVSEEAPAGGSNARIGPEFPLPPGRPSSALSPEEGAALEEDAPAAVAAEDHGIDLAAFKKALDHYRGGRISAGDESRALLDDRAAGVLTEWLAIRSGAPIAFERIIAFMRDHRDWPGGAGIRRRAEEALLWARQPPEIVQAFFASQRPVTGAGKLALALAFKAEGSHSDSVALIREAWRGDALSRQLEERILANFPGTLTRADHRHRMEKLLFARNWAGAERAANFAGADHLKLVQARRAVEQNARTASKALDAVPASLRTDTSYLFSRARFLRRTDKHLEAAKVVQAMKADPALLADGDAWWIERRAIARELLELGQARLAYEIAAGHAAQSPAERIEAEFHAGWIALRYLDDAQTASGHFDTAATIPETPISVARVAYWQGRAAEAAGDAAKARLHYEHAANHSVAFYGQLARGRLGHRALALRSVEHDVEATRARLAEMPVVRAIRLLHKAGEPQLALALFAELGRTLDDAALLDGLGELAVELQDPRGLLAIGKSAIQRGLPLDLHAYPTMGIPSFSAVGAHVDKALVYAIARQESAFNPKAMSGAGARGLMQLMPATAKRTAQRFGVAFNLDRLVTDPAYNAKIGSAHLSELMEDWNGSHILVFAAYNAGGGNVRRWINRFGDPRSPGVDPVDWIEQIPFAETRNYVQRVMENFQVYRHRLGSVGTLALESDLRHSNAGR